MFDIADLVSQFGAFYIKNEANLSRLYSKLYYELSTLQVLQKRRTEDTLYRVGEVEIETYAQPFQVEFTPAGTKAIKPQEIKLYAQKMDFEFYPDSFVDSWADFLIAEGVNEIQYPFVRWILENHMIPKFNENFELSEIWSGVNAAPTPGTESAKGEAMDGLHKIIKDEIAGGGIPAGNVIPTGANDADPVTFLEQIESFVGQIDKRYWMQPLQIAMSETLALRFKQGMRAKYNLHYAQETDLLKLANFNAKVIGLPSMAGSEKFWTTTPGNALYLVKRERNMRPMMQQIDRKVKFLTTAPFHVGVGFIMPSLVWTNDLENV